MRWRPRNPYEWCPFFCWLPFLVEGEWVWLETVETRMVRYDAMLGPDYQYRLIGEA